MGGIPNRGTAPWSLGQYNEVLVAVARALPRALEDTDPKRVIAALGARGEMLAQKLHKVIALLAPRFRQDMAGKEGWMLLEDVEAPTEIVIPKLELVPLLKQGESAISGEEMRKRAKELGANLGQYHAEHLEAFETEIPEEFRQFHLLFPGTQWNDQDGRQLMPYMVWRHGWWSLSFCASNLKQGPKTRLLRPHNAP